jgi:RNA polymerase sigma factor (sigma-70 family)
VFHCQIVRLYNVTFQFCIRPIIAMIKKALFLRIVQQHKDRVFGYSCYFLRNREDAEDVTQDVFVRLWQHWDEIDRNKIKAWIMQVAHHRCIDFTRKRKKIHENFYETKSNTNSFVCPSSTIAEDPNEQVELSETQCLLLNVLEGLPERTKSMMLMHYFQDLKFETIAEVLDVNINTVKVTIHRGRKMLKDVIEKEYPEMAEVFA